jgi:hypothetical protein
VHSAIVNIIRLLNRPPAQSDFQISDLSRYDRQNEQLFLRGTLRFFVEPPIFVLIKETTRQKNFSHPVPWYLHRAGTKPGEDVVTPGQIEIPELH